MITTPPLTPAERKRAQRSRLRQLGRVLLELWVHPIDRAKILLYVAKVNRARAAVLEAHNESPKVKARTK